MRTCLTCFCGGQAWTVFQDAVECERCGNLYPLVASYSMPNVALFNAARDDEHDQDQLPLEETDEDSKKDSDA